jgi:chorismate synthase
MAILNYVTAGESHGKGILALVEGLPAGLPLDLAEIGAALVRRQKGHGRGPRQAIEEDRAEVLAGLRAGKTLGSPLVLWIGNRDASLDSLPPVVRPRPGHGDLAGCLKIGCKDARDVLERSSARETAARVAAGAAAVQLLRPFGVRAFAHTISIGPVEAKVSRIKEIAPELVEKREASPVRCLDEEAGKAMVAAIDAADREGDTLGGVIEAVATGVLPGVGGYDRWESRLGSRIAAAVMGVPSVKGVEIGQGFAAARKRGSEVHDEILFNPLLVQDGKPHGFLRSSNRAGGIEGGMSNGEPVWLRAALKPIPTLKKPLRTVDLSTGRGAEAAQERADVCAVASAAIVIEAVLAFEIARAYRDKFGGDSIEEMTRNVEGYIQSLRDFIP